MRSGKDHRGADYAEVVEGGPAQGWLILRNGAVTIGLFQGMFLFHLSTLNQQLSSHWA